MLFIHPMWSSETERIGKQRCTPLGYALHVIADLLGGIGFLTLLGMILWLIFCALSETYTFPTYWIFTVPFAIGLLSEIIFHISWHLAFKKGYTYSYEADTAEWLEDGHKVTYTYGD